MNINLLGHKLVSISNATAFFRIELVFGIGMFTLVVAYWIIGRVTKVLQKKEDIEKQRDAEAQKEQVIIDHDEK